MAKAIDIRQHLMSKFFPMQCFLYLYIHVYDTYVYIHAYVKVEFAKNDDMLADWLSDNLEGGKLPVLNRCVLGSNYTRSEND